MASEEEKTLIKKRGSLKSKVTIFSNHIVKLQQKLLPDGSVNLNDQEICELQERLSKVKLIYSEYDDVQTDIEQITADPDSQFKERETFENTFHSLIASARCMLKVTEGDLASSHRSVSQAGSIVSQPDVNETVAIKPVKLPDIKLPVFSGDYNMWLEFRDLYLSLIHDREDMDPIQKFHYLRASLEGNAAQVIKSIEFSASNYSLAYELLCKRYNNENILINNHLEALFSLEKITKGTSMKFRLLSDNVSKHLRALKMLNLNVEHWDVMIIHLINKSFDPRTVSRWEEYKARRESVELEDMYTFLRQQADLLERLECNSNFNKTDQYHKGKARSLVVSDNSTGEASSLVSSYDKCSYCNENHKVYFCEKFKRLSVNERFEHIKKNKLCINCLKSNHFSKQCRMKASCTSCSARHNSLLHLNFDRDKDKSKEDIQVTSQVKEESSNKVTLTVNHINQTLLPTVMVRVFDDRKESHAVRALLDSGSMSCFITENLCKRLNLKMNEINFAVSGISNTSCTIKYKTDVEIHSRLNNYSTKISCLILPEITNQIPSTWVNVSSLEIPNNIKLADPIFHKPSGIDLLIGAEVFWQLLCVGQVNLGRGKPVLQKTKLGWIISGNVEKSCNRNKTVCHFSQNLGCNKSVESQLIKFLELEEVTNKSSWSEEETGCESHFLETHTRLENGHFEVTIPLKTSENKLGDSFDQAKRRFLSLEHKLQKDLNLKDNYSQFLFEYEQLNHMTKVTDDVSSLENKEKCYFLPHHAVWKQNGEYSKCRVVFDASASTTSGLSFNDIQMVGPTIQDDLLTILLRFREHSFVFSADIEKMYRQVYVAPEQRTLQMILWRDNPEDNLKAYMLNTVTYGMAASAFLAVRSLTELGNQCSETLPQVSEIIKHDFYVDDLLSGCSSISEAKTICSNLNSVLKSGGFSLRKWRSNEPEIVENLQSNSDQCKYLQFGTDNAPKVLGLMWCDETDKLLFNINIITNTKNITKRVILSCIGKVFDPLGLLSPCVITAKVLLQQLWCERLPWDESVPLKVFYAWTKFVDELPLLNNLNIQRNVICRDAIYVELHLFSDASESAYGCCAYMRSIDKKNQIHCHLLCSKTKVAPLKPTTIPRLELCAAFVLSKLYCKIQDSLRLKIDKCFFWTDSKIVLGWINTSAHLLKPFVRNRILEIQEATNTSNWRYVPSAYNPADLLSRGVSPREIGNSSLWWHGPSWLSQESSFWPADKVVECELPELKPHEQSLISVNSNLAFPFEIFSKLNRLKRCCAYMLRFKVNCQTTKENRNLGPLTANEIYSAFMKLILISQISSFSQEYHCLLNKKPLDKKCKILNLNPFIDDQGLIRVGGRLANSHFDFNKRHPILLSSNHLLTKLILEHEHRQLLHAGPQLLLASVRENFWPLHGRNLARSVVHGCLRCYRFKVKNIQPIMGNLPSTRFLSGFPFQVTGVDYAGPVSIKEKKGRGAKLLKSYICVFVCFSTKCLHLELVSDLSTETFLLAFRRFIARRGKPLHMYSDNGSNFKKANKDLEELGKFIHDNQLVIQEYIHNQQISWHFIPAYAPNFGGLWEAGVKSTKHHLKRVLNNAYLTFEEMSTLLTQIEAVLNSRPLSPLSSDALDPNPLTPAHFLLGRPLTSPVEPNLEDVPENRLNRYQRLEQLRQQFWSKWHKEYIAELQQRTKWKTNYDNLQPGALVLIKDDHLPALCWHLGRIVAFFPGKDNVSRVAQIRTANGLIKRQFSKICPLPIKD